MKTLVPRVRGGAGPAVVKEVGLEGWIAVKENEMKV
jgi:hypothetical protein